MDVTVPAMDWDSSDLPGTWIEFKRRALSLLTGEGKFSDKAEKEKVGLLLGWVGKRGQQILREMAGQGPPKAKFKNIQNPGSARGRMVTSAGGHTAKVTSAGGRTAKVTSAGGRTVTSAGGRTVRSAGAPTGTAKVTSAGGHMATVQSAVKRSLRSAGGRMAAVTSAGVSRTSAPTVVGQPTLAKAWTAPETSPAQTGCLQEDRRPDPQDSDQSMEGTKLDTTPQHMDRPMKRRKLDGTVGQLKNDSKDVDSQLSTNASDDNGAGCDSEDAGEIYSTSSDEETPVHKQLCEKSQNHKGHTRSYKCEFCHTSFTLKCILKKHLATHRPYKCGICDKAFTEKGNLKRHSITHTGERPYTCGICHKAFSLKSILTAHSVTHSEERPYKCEICHKSFTFKCVLKKHSVTHTGERPYQCEICRASFKFKHVLKAHSVAHNARERPYKKMLDLPNLLLSNVFSRNTQ